MEAAAALRAVEALRLSMQEMTRQMLEDKYKDILRQAEEVKQAYESFREAAAQAASSISPPSTPTTAPAACKPGHPCPPQTVRAFPESEAASWHSQGMGARPVAPSQAHARRPPLWLASQDAPRNPRRLVLCRLLGQAVLLRLPVGQVSLFRPASQAIPRGPSQEDSTFSGTGRTQIGQASQGHLGDARLPGGVLQALSRSGRRVGERFRKTEKGHQPMVKRKQSCAARTVASVSHT